MSPWSSNRLKLSKDPSSLTSIVHHRLPRNIARSSHISSGDATCSIAKLPDEIILEAFHFCVGTPDTSLGLAGTDSLQDLTDPGTAPLNVSQVCKRWRRIALSSPMLWSVVILETGLLQQRHFVAVDTWITRSKSTPLTISLMIGDSTQSKDVALDFFRHFMTHNGRIKVLHLRLNCLFPTGLETDVANGPLLEDFSFTSTYTAYIPLGLIRSPRVTNLKLHGPIRFSVRLLSELQHLDVDLRDMPTDFLGRLGLLPSLETLTIKFTYWTFPEEPSNISLPKLRSLRLQSGLTVESSFAVLGHLFGFAPSLATLELSSAWSYSPHRWRQLISIMERRKPRLLNLSIRINSEMAHIENDAPEAGYLGTLLWSTPDLTSLSSNYGTDERFVRAMTLQSATDVGICPKLEEVHFGRFSEAVTAHYLVNMIVSRINMGGKALKRVKLTPFHYHAISRRKVIKMSMSRGLQLSSSASKY